MYFSQTAEYALRAVVFLSALEEGEAMSGHELSKRTGVPQHYLSKIMRKMVVDGLVESQRGHRGGFHLSRPPSEIRFIDVLEAADGAPMPDRCVFGWSRCDTERPCPLHDAWNEMAEAFRRWGSQNTFGDKTWSIQRLDELVAHRLREQAGGSDEDPRETE